MHSAKKIFLFGSGSAAKDFLSMIPDSVSVLGICDSDNTKHGQSVDGHRIVSPETLADSSFDYVVITARAVDPIRQALHSNGIDPAKVVAYYPSYSQELHSAANHDIAVLNGELGLGLGPVGLATMYLDRSDDTLSADAGPRDAVRDGAFRLAARQIKARGIAGSVAELGVYQGDQARLINQLFPDRPLYLFDTFSGFSERDLGVERQDSLSTAVLGDFKETSVELVMGKLVSPEMARVFPGYFPDTAAGVDDRFAFVSLDVDLYDPTRAGLDWFYARLNTGGFIFVHDYNNLRYQGVRRAVDEFVAASGAVCLPLPDFAGSVIIGK